MQSGLRLLIDLSRTTYFQLVGIWSTGPSSLTVANPIHRSELAPSQLAVLLLL